MGTGSTEARQLAIGNIKIEIYPDGKAAGAAAAQTAAGILHELTSNRADVGVIFATGVSQLDILKSLTSMSGLPWERVTGFHLDEYIGLPADHPASFRHYLRKNLIQRVQMKRFFEIDGSAENPERECVSYAEHLRTCGPHLCFLGIGENGHLAFNDPGEANFEDPRDVKIVELDEISRNQQIEERWFHKLDEVPKRAISLTIPAIMRVPRLLVTAPGRRKAEIVRRALEEPVSTDCPATVLRTHSNVVLYLDEASAAELNTH